MSKFKFELTSDKSGYILTRVHNVSETISVPETYHGKPVVALRDHVFCGCAGLTSVTIPNGVMSIGPYAFSGCYSLMNINIPDGVTSIGFSTFSDCVNLMSIDIPNSVTNIGAGAFADCTSLININIPDSVTSIGYGAFNNCRSLTSINIPSSVTSIGSGAFFGCSDLTNVTIVNGVESIGSWAFECCSNLRSINIPDSVTNIGRGAFYGCEKLFKKGNFKATDNNMTCRDYQYEMNKKFHCNDKIKLCESGFHYCQNAFDVFNYYCGEISTDVRIFDVEPEGISDETQDYSKRVCSDITFVKEYESFAEFLN